MAKTITLTIKYRWWLGYYLSGVKLTAQITGLDPDFQRVKRWVSRGIYFK